jgi:D-arabinose 1-dehydrogenase-like Zn-dependent alcohol dehydrogenase
MYAPGDVRVEERSDPRIVEATDAIIRLPATCICGSDLWPYRGLDMPDWPMPMGHEYVAIVEEVGSEVTAITRPTSSSRASWPRSTCSVRAGSAPWQPRSARARPRRRR